MNIAKVLLLTTITIAQVFSSNYACIRISLSLCVCVSDSKLMSALDSIAQKCYIFRTVWDTKTHDEKDAKKNKYKKLQQNYSVCALFMGEFRFRTSI